MRVLPVLGPSALLAVLAVAPAGAMTLDSPAPGATVDSRTSFAWTYGPGATAGGISVFNPGTTSFQSPFALETTFTPPEPLGAGPHTWQGTEEIPGPDGSVETVKTAEQRFTVAPSIRLAPLKLRWKGDTSFDLNRPNGSRMTLTRRFTQSNLEDAYEITTVTRGGKRFYRVQGRAATHGEQYLSPLTRTATFLLPTLPKGRYKVTTEIRGGRTASAPVRVRATGTLVVTRRAPGFGRKSEKRVCSIDVTQCVNTG